MAAATRVRVSTRARRVSIRVHEDATVELVVPRGVPEARARAFLVSRADWVERQRRRRLATARPPESFPPQLLELPALGESWRLETGVPTGRARLRETAPGVLEMSGVGAPAQWRARLLAWLKRRALQAWQPFLVRLAGDLGFSFRVLSVRLLRSRWGSCTSRGRISINLAMLFQPPEVLRYLMCHELAHTRHMNHSGAFWRCVAASEPQWRQLDRQLTRGWQHVPRWLLALPEEAT